MKRATLTEDLASSEFSSQFRGIIEVSESVYAPRLHSRYAPLLFSRGSF